MSTSLITNLVYNCRRESGITDNLNVPLERDMRRIIGGFLMCKLKSEAGNGFHRCSGHVRESINKTITEIDTAAAEGTLDYAKRSALRNSLHKELVDYARTPEGIAGIAHVIRSPDPAVASRMFGIPKRRVRDLIKLGAMAQATSLTQMHKKVAAKHTPRIDAEKQEALAQFDALTDKSSEEEFAAAHRRILDADRATREVPMYLERVERMYASGSATLNLHFFNGMQKQMESMNLSGTSKSILRGYLTEMDEKHRAKVLGGMNVGNTTEIKALRESLPTLSADKFDSVSARIEKFEKRAVKAKRTREQGTKTLQSIFDCMERHKLL